MEVGIIRPKIGFIGEIHDDGGHPVNEETGSRLGLKEGLIYCLLLNGLLFFGILTTHRLYIDDIGRSMLGYSQWSRVGRPLAAVFTAIVQLGTPLINLFPLPQIVAIFIISFTSISLARSYSVRSPFFSAVCTLPLAGQPYFLENMSYSFDSPSMALALSFSVYAAILLAGRGIRSFVVPVLLLLAALSLYQPAVGAFFVTYIFLIIRNVNTENRPGEYFARHLCRLGMSSCLAFLFYLPIMRMFVTADYARQHGKIVGLQSLLDKVSSNTQNYVGWIFSAWAGNITGYIFALLLVLSLVISVLQVTRSSNRQSAVRIAVYAIICLMLGVGTIVAAYFPQMFLLNPIIVPRTLIGFGAVLSCCCLYVFSYMDSNFLFLGRYRRYIVAVPVCLVAYALLLFSYSYSKANGAQDQYENLVISRLLSDTGQLVAEKDVTRFSIAGNIGRSPLVVNSARKYPLILSLVPVHISDNWYWGYMQLKFMGLSLDEANVTEEEKLSIIRHNKPVVRNPSYELYVIDDLLLIRFLAPGFTAS